MVYGIISSLDDAGTKTVFQSKKIRNERVFYFNQLNALREMLVSGDVVYVMSVNRFLNLSQVCGVAEFCFQRGISLRFIEQPYLNVGNGKCWRKSVICLTDRMLQLEKYAENRMQQVFRFNSEQWEYMSRCIERMSLEILAQIFSSDGIMKRGS